MNKIALISVSDKTGVKELSQMLVNMEYTILSTGGTAKKIRECVEDKSCIMDVSDYTGYSESPNGLVKTLHPKIYAGLLMNPNNPEHAQYMMKIGAFPIDVVAVNLYPFAETIAKPGITEEQAYEQIDIGGPTMLRAAAKGCLLNGKPLVVCDPKDYERALEVLSSKCPAEDMKKFSSSLARKVFQHTAEYESTIDNFFLDVEMKKVRAEKDKLED